MASVESSHQSISFCGVGAHHQSGVAEHRIRELTELARTQLLHAIHNNPKAVNEKFVALCPMTRKLSIQSVSLNQAK